MAKADIAQTGLVQATARFPEAAARLRRVALRPGLPRPLRGTGLAKEHRDRFEARPDAAERLEAPECRSVPAQLEGKIDRRLGEERPEC